MRGRAVRARPEEGSAAEDQVEEICGEALGTIPTAGDEAASRSHRAGKLSREQGAREEYRVR